MRFFIIGLAVLLTGCEMLPKAYQSLDLEHTDDQVFSYSSGIKVVSSKKLHAVSIAPFMDQQELNNRISIWLSVVNNSNEPMHLSIDNVKAIYKTATSASVVVPVPYKILAQDINKIRAKQERSARIGAALSSLGNTGQSTAVTTTTGTTSGQAVQGNNYLNSYNYSGSYSGTSYTTVNDPAKKKLLDNQTRVNLENRISRIGGNAAAIIGALKESYFRRQTVPSNGSYTGLVTLDLGEKPLVDGSYVITVAMGDEAHEFTLNNIVDIPAHIIAAESERDEGGSGRARR